MNYLNLLHLYTPVVGRLLISSIFLMAGISKITFFKAFSWAGWIWVFFGGNESGCSVNGIVGKAVEGYRFGCDVDGTKARTFSGR